MSPIHHAALACSLLALACTSPAAECFAPDRSPERARDGDILGCTCSAPAALCVRDADGSWVALRCESERWVAGDDAACPAGTGPACEVDGVVYAPGSEGVPDAFTTCNTCTCGGGCTEVACDEPVSCPPGTVLAAACVGCGLAGGCTRIRYGCQPACTSSEDCTDPTTPACDPSAGVCTVGGCA